MKKLDYFTSIEWYLNLVISVTKIEEKLNMDTGIIFESLLMLTTQNYLN